MTSQQLNDNILKQKNQDEIDLAVLVGILWGKKLLIVIITLLTTSLAALYAFTAKEQWTAKAYVVAPRTQDIQSYIDLRREYARSLSSSTDVSSALSGQFFADFIQLARSPDEKIRFLQQTAYYEQQTKDLTAAQDKRRWLEEQINKKLLITPPDAKKNLDYYSISMQADSAFQAKNLLEQYIKLVSDKSFDRSNYEFYDSMTALVLSLQKEKRDIESRLKLEREQTIKYLTDALTVAKAAGIKDHRGNNDNLQFINNVDKFMLGETILSAELKNLHENPLVYPYRYYQIDEQLEAISALNKIGLENEQAYRYEFVPVEPAVRDAPKRGLIVLLGILLGCAIVLVNHMIVNNKLILK